jgi:AAA domain-containing protein
MPQLTHSILVLGPSGAGKSTFARGALVAEGSGLVVASPLDELDSYLGLDAPKYVFGHFDDSLYLPSADAANVGTPTGLRDAVRWLRLRYAEVAEDAKAGKPPRYAILVLDTVSALGVLATNTAMHKYGRNEPPAAMSPDGAAFYTYLRQRQEELLRIARAFRGFGVHLIALSHVTETDVKDTAVAKVTEGASRMNMPAVPGAFRAALPSFFSTVLYAGVIPGQNNERIHYVQWKADPKRPTKNRFGALDTNDRIRNEWLVVKQKIEDAAARRLNPAPATT